MTDTHRRDVLAQALREIRELKARQAAVDARARAPIAVIGLGCRLPGADDPDALWRLLCAGVDATGEVPAGRWTEPEPPGMYVRRGGWLREVDGFDAAFFGVGPREAQSLDPQQRLFLEVVWETLEHAAIAPDRLRDSRTGVYCGITQVDYAQVLATHADPEQLDAHAGTGISPNFAAGRVARLLDLRGPALAIDTACSSSLVAVHLAVEALRRGTVDLALAGGVNLILQPAGHAVLCQARALSPSGRCQTFDAAADGYARAEGCGVVALARLDDARRAGHRILAVIRGSAIGHDGASAGLTVPSGAAQADVIAAACADAGVEPRSVAYVEAHGTGTALGDPIELRALADALGRDRAAPLLVGALKTNLGHLESAAGVAGLIKVVLALHHGELPPQLGPARPSPAVDWARLPIEVVRARRSWPEGPRLAGISAFGASGTNAHVVLAAADDDPLTDEPDDASPELLVLSALTPAARTALAARWAASLRGANSLAAACRTAAIGRAALPHAVAVVARTADEMAARLIDAVEIGAAPHVGRRPATPVPLAFVFAGQGARPELVPDLFARPGPYRAALERCDAVLRAHRPGSLIDLLAPRDGESPLDETEWAQPALFAVEWALVEQWRAWGVEPRWVLGHSLGAFVAACLAGVMDLESALKLVARRAELMQLTPPGAMAAVFAGEDQVRAVLAALPGAPAIAAVNGPQDTVLSGDAAAVAEALRVLEVEGIRGRLLAVRRGFHSPLMDGILDAFASAVGEVRLHSPDRIFISDTTGHPVTHAWTDPAVWRRHLREPVRFADALRALHDDGCRLCVEIGPGTALSAAGRRAGIDLRWFPSLRRDTPGRASMLEALGQLAVAGARVDLAAATRGRRTAALPTYPFERRRAWLGPGGRTEAVTDDSLLGRRLDAPDGEAVFEARWRADGPAVLRDHRVFGRCVVSGAVAGSVALAAARQFDGDRPFLLEALEFHAPLILPERGGLTLRTRLTRRDDHLELTIESHDRGRKRVHVTGRIRPTTESPPPPRPLAAIRESCPDTLTGDAFYTRFWRPDLHDLGPSYRTLEQIWRRDGEALARLRPPPLTAAGTEAALWTAIAYAEATGQVLMPAVPGFEAVFGERGDTFLGSGMTRSVQHDRPLASAAWIHARLDAIGPDGFAGEVAILDDEGRALVVTEGLAVRRIAPDQLRRATARADVADGRPVLEAPHAARPDRLRAWLDETVAALIGADNCDHDLPLARLGFDSLATVDLLERLQSALHVRLAAGAALRDQTLASLAAQVLSALARDQPAPDPSSTPDAPPVSITPDAPAPATRDAIATAAPTSPADGCWRLIGAAAPGARLRLFCLPHAGASAMAFQPWRGHVPPTIEVRAAQLPGRWTEPGTPLTDLDALVAALIADLRPRLVDGPWALFGASLGGLLAFEVARALRREGGPQPTHLIVAGTPTPDGPHPLAADAGGLRSALAGDGDPRALVRLGLVPAAQVSADMLPLLLPALRADLELVLRHRHHPGEPLACPILCLLGSADLAVRRQHVTGWVAHTDAEFTLRRVDGAHLFYRDAPAPTWRALTRWLAGD